MKRNVRNRSRRHRDETALARRIAAFLELAQRFKHSAPSLLMAVHTIDKDLMECLRYAVATYMSRSMPFDTLFLDEQNLIDAYEKHEQNILTLTPNGMIVPKRNTTLEFNGVIKAFMQIINSMNFSDVIGSWHIPLNVRIKFGRALQKNIKRARASENIHSDSWAGISAESATISIPLFGDTDGNWVQYYHPPPVFQEDWLGALTSYSEGAEIAAQYRPIDFVTPKGSINISDVSVLHASSRSPGCGTRVSLETTFVFKKPWLREKVEVIHPWRKTERISPEVMSLIGEKYMLVFYDAPADKVYSKGGFKHPTNLKVVRIQD